MGWGNRGYWNTGSYGSDKYQGTWNANTNTPALASGIGVQGYYYRVAVGGATNLDGVTDWVANDIVYFDGSAWRKTDSTDLVLSVFGRTAAVVASAGDYTADKITNTPAGTIAATNVQSAINELDTEKLGAMINDIGVPGQMGFGVGLCPAANLPAGFAELALTKLIGSAQYGNYQFSDGSIMCWIPRHYYRIDHLSNPTYAANTNIKAVSAVTAANPGEVTITGHQITAGTTTADIRFDGIVGMTQLNGNTYTCTYVDANRVTIGVDTSGYTAYSSGGWASGPGNSIDVQGISKFTERWIAITAMTRANPCVVTAAAHGLVNGDYIWISHITAQAEWKELSGKLYKVANKTNDTFELTDTAGVNINTSGYVAAFILATDASATLFYNSAHALGYALGRGFVDGGKIQPGFMVDKYMVSKNALGTGYVASSLPFGLPLSSASTHNPFSGLTGGTDTYGSLVDLAHRRDGVNGLVNATSIFNCTSRFQWASLARLSLAHGQAALSTSQCAWWLSGSIFPKGCNDNALKDTNDATVKYESDGYSNCGKTGSGSVFAKTTHNGQDCGVCDVNGLMYEIHIGATCIATAAAIGGMSQAAACEITWTNHGLATNDVVQIEGITQADWSGAKDKLWSITKTGDNTFTIPFNSSGFGTPYDAVTDPGTVTKGIFYAAKPGTAMKSFTSGNSAATDHWGATGVAAMMSAFVPAFKTSGGVAFGQRFGSGVNRVLGKLLDGNNWLLTGLGFPKDAFGMDGSGTATFGTDYYYQYIRNELCLISSYHWDAGSDAGVWGVYWYYYRTNSNNHVGGRLACYPV
jgi:hypothetical protein